MLKGNFKILLVVLITLFVSFAYFAPLSYAKQEKSKAKETKQVAEENPSQTPTENALPVTVTMPLRPILVKPAPMPAVRPRTIQVTARPLLQPVESRKLERISSLAEPIKTTKLEKLSESAKDENT